MGIDFQHFLDKKEQDRVFEFVSEYNKPIFQFMRYTACRPNEAGALQKRSIDLKNKMLIIENALGKGRRLKDTKTKQARPLPLIPEILEVIKPLMDTARGFHVLYKKWESI